MTKNIDMAAIMAALNNEFEANTTPIVDLIEAQTKDPFKVLVATILSARTKDETTASVVRRLFEEVDGPADLKRLSEAEIRDLIYPVGFYKNKAKYLSDLPDVLNEKFGGLLPRTVEELCELPGVGRKTANLVVAVGFHLPAICVDVHVHRICNRLGYLETKDPLQTEMALREKLPQQFWIAINSRFVSFGQNTCRPTSPHCSRCPIIDYCNQIGVEQSR